MKPKPAPLFARRAAECRKQLRLATGGQKTAARKRLVRAVADQLKAELRA